jgi:hypothetical protein
MLKWSTPSATLGLTKTAAGPGYARVKATVLTTILLPATNRERSKELAFTRFQPLSQWVVRRDAGCVHCSLLHYDHCVL